MARHAHKYEAAVSVYTAYNDLHRNARKYQIDLQAPENTSHFAMRITLFSSLIDWGCTEYGNSTIRPNTEYLASVFGWIRLEIK